MKVSALLAVLLACAAAAAQAYTPPSPPPSYWDYFSDSYYTLASRSANPAALTVSSAGASQAVGSTTAFQQQYEVLLNYEDNTYRIRNRESGLCIGSLNGGTTAGTAVVTGTYTGAATQKWLLTGTGGGYWDIVNAGASLALQTDAGNPATVTLQPVNTADTRQQWLVHPDAPASQYPKKGTAGYDGEYARWNSSWAYNWGPTGAAGSAAFAYCPMKWGPNWPGVGELGGGYTALHTTPKPVYVLGFNEPDHTDQSNATVATAISQWQSLLDLNVPLCSPAPASTWGGWMSDFYTSLGSKRCDYTAIHAYTNNFNVDTYINNINSVKNTWGRKVWITEFSLTNWGGSVSWTEENCYTFLSEFMWRAEDVPNLKRYSLYLFPGTPPANPWTAYGTDSYCHAIYGNGTLTAIGELYAAWDADRTVRARIPYMIQGQQSMHRINSGSPAANPTYLGTSNIRVSDATAQWTLVPSPTSGQYYIVSLSDHRRLYTDGNGVYFTAANTTGTGVQWQVTAPDSAGYVYINNLATSKTLFNQRWPDSSAAPTSVYYGLVSMGSPSNITRFRLIKPVAPVSVPPGTPVVPSNLTATAGDRRVALTWTASPGGTTYLVSRATSAAGPFTQIANVTTPAYDDNTPANDGTTYYYQVVATNSLDETATSAQVSATPAASLAVSQLEANYKFEAGDASDNSGKRQAGTVFGGVTYFTPGKVDASAVSFDGSSGYVDLPVSVAKDFSIAFWMRTTVAGTTGTQWWQGAGLVDAEVGGAVSDFGVALLGTKAAFGVGNVDTTITSASAVNDGAWHHIVATRSNTSGAMQLYVDGALQATGTGPAGTRAAPPFMRLGASRAGAHFYSGALDEVRVYSYVLGAGEIAQLQRAGARLTALYPLDTNAQDSSGAGNHGTAGSVVSFPGGASGKVGAGAAGFFGSLASTVDTPNPLVMDFSIAYWMKTTTAYGSGTQWWQGAGLVDGEVSGAAADFGTALLVNKAAFGVGNPGGADTTIVSTSTVNDGAWHHIVATRTNANGTMRLYVDGALQATGAGPIGARTATNVLRMGSIAGGYGFYNGWLDDVRLYNYAMSAGQVLALMNPAPAPWTAQDIGNPAGAGFAGYVSGNGAWTVGGGGADIWGTSDQFHFVSAPISGAGTLITRVTSQPTNPDGTLTNDAKEGIMFRESTAANSAFVDLVLDVGQGLQFHNRPSTGAAVIQTEANVTGVFPPYWLKLVRGGNTFAAYYALGSATPAANGWTLIGTATVALAANSQAGLAVTSHADGTVATAGFDNFALLPNAAPTLTPPVNQSVATGTTTAALPVTVGDAETPAASLTLTSATSNPALVPANAILLGGSGVNRIVRITPVADRAGTATITLTASDGQASTSASFVLTVTSTPAGNWRQDNFGTTANTGDAADAADPDVDGVSNYWERALGMNPKAANINAWPTAAKTQDSFLSMTYPRVAGATDLSYQVQWSNDLRTWSAENVTDTVTGGDGTVEQRTGKVPMSLGSPIFLRLQVTRSP